MTQDPDVCASSTIVFEAFGGFGWPGHSDDYSLIVSRFWCTQIFVWHFVSDVPVCLMELWFNDKCN